VRSTYCLGQPYPKREYIHFPFHPGAESHAGVFRAGSTERFYSSINPSAKPAKPSSFVFVAKKDGGLRPCIDNLYNFIWVRKGDAWKTAFIENYENQTTMKIRLCRKGWSTHLPFFQGFMNDKFDVSGVSPSLRHDLLRGHLDLILEPG